jgi:formate hydrogenlyase subunit 3/multisubunit Na+/H+ antiporter MnhD subunit
MAWIGLLTTLGGAAMALKQDDVKLMLAYSSMSQIGYIMTAIAMMSHLGWVTAMYLIANHLMVKGILFLVAAAVILRTGTRRFDEISGLMTAMPLTFLLAVVALLSMSGLPPLVGFGAKWLLLSAMIDRGWYGLAALGVAATLLGLLYMFRFAYAIFLSPPQGDRLYLREAPISLLAPQALLAVGILALSFFPKLVMGPISAAIDPEFSSRLVWQGMSLEEVYAHWNPLPAMTVALMLSAAIFLVAWLIYRGNLGRFSKTGIDAFYRFYKPALAAVTEPLARAVWNGTSAAVIGAAQWVRQAYTGNGQTYSLQILCYIIVLYLFGTYARG